MLTAEQEAELTDLARRYGEPVRWERRYMIDSPRNEGWLMKIARRRGEVILVPPRPGARWLVHTKSTYPDGVYRLPGGGIDPEEPVALAARREAHEELGMALEPARLLGVIENRFELAGRPGLIYPSYILQLPPTVEPPRVLDTAEPITDFREVTAEELALIAGQLNSLPVDWQPWGRFRAAPHELVVEALLMER